MSTSTNMVTKCTHFIIMATKHEQNSHISRIWWEGNSPCDERAIEEILCDDVEDDWWNRKTWCDGKRNNEVIRDEEKSVKKESRKPVSYAL